MKVLVCFRSSENELHCRGIVSAALIEFLQTFKAMAGARKLLSKSRQFSVSITDRFMTANHSIDGRFALSLQSNNSLTSFGQLLRKMFCLKFSFSVLGSSSFAFAGKTFSL